MSEFKEGDSVRVKEECYRTRHAGRHGFVTRVASTGDHVVGIHVRLDLDHQDTVFEPIVLELDAPKRVQRFAPFKVGDTVRLCGTDYVGFGPAGTVTAVVVDVDDRITVRFEGHYNANECRASELVIAAPPPSAPHHLGPVEPIVTPVPMPTQALRPIAMKYAPQEWVHLEPVTRRSDANAKCLRCGGPAYTGLLHVECLRRGGCQTLEERVGEPSEVMRHSERLVMGNEVFWRASGVGMTGEHPTRDGAIEAWKTKMREVMR